MAVRKKITFLLIWLLFLSVFLGGHYHFCHYHSQTCSIFSVSQPLPYLPPVPAVGEIEPPLLITVFRPFETLVPDYISFITPLRGRAPPCLS